MTDPTTPIPPSPRPITVGARVEIAVDNLAMPKGTRGTAIEALGLVSTPTPGWIVRFDGGGELAYRGTDLRVIDETPEELVARLTAGVRFAPSYPTAGRPMPLPFPPAGYPSSGYTPMASCCGPSCFPTPQAEPEYDDSISDELADIVRGQALAMLAARTRSGLGIASMAVLTQAKGDVMYSAVKGALRGVFGNLVDLVDAVPFDAAAKAILDAITARVGVPPIPVAGPHDDRVMARIEVNGEFVGFMAMTPPLTPESVVAAIRADALALAKVPGEVVDLDLSLPGVVKITTRPHQQPAATPTPE